MHPPTGLPGRPSANPAYDHARINRERKQVDNRQREQLLGPHYADTDVRLYLAKRRRDADKRRRRGGFPFDDSFERPETYLKLGEAFRAQVCEWGCRLGVMCMGMGGVWHTFAWSQLDEDYAYICLLACKQWLHQICTTKRCPSRAGKTLQGQPRIFECQHTRLMCLISALCYLFLLCIMSMEH